MKIADDYLANVLAGNENLLFDGAMGSMLMQTGLMGGIHETLCITNPEAITDIHRAYVEAGCQIVTTNTFGANALRLEGHASVEDVFAAAVKCARASGARYVAGDIGPTGEMLDPIGDLEFEEAYELFAEQARAIAKTDADLVIIETMTDPNEMEAALTATKDNCDLPIVAMMSFGETGRTYMGCSVEDAVELIEELGADVVGANCTLTPADMKPIANRLLACAHVPVIIEANAGHPDIVDGKPAYSLTPEQFAADMKPIVDAGVHIIGGCCGTNPAVIAELAKLL